VHKTDDRPGPPAITWRVEMKDSSGETIKVIADLKGTILDVVQPASRQQKPNWLDPNTIATMIGKIGEAFGGDVKIASIVIDNRGARVSIQPPGSEAAVTYDYNGHGFTRASFTFAMGNDGPRFALADIARMDQAIFQRLEADALKRLAPGRQAWLESVHLGAQMFATQAGARAIEIRVRNQEVDSVRAEYGWIIYGFDGRVLDSSPM
jgi:hypothetical protein